MLQIFIVHNYKNNFKVKMYFKIQKILMVAKAITTLEITIIYQLVNYFNPM